MSEKLTWNAQKKELWKKNPAELMQKLQELETEKMKMEINTRLGGHMVNRANIADGKKNFKIKDLRHKIACIKTMLNVKLKGGMYA